MNQQDHRPDTQQQHFDHHRLDAWRIGFQALIEGDRISKAIPRGYGKLKDQLDRALQGAFTLTSEAAAVLEALAQLRAADPAAAASVIGKLWRLSAMLTRLATPKR